MPTIQIDDHSIHYTEHTSPAAGPTLLLIHGAGASHQVWPEAMRQLPGAGVLALDLPGHGDSPPPGRRSVEQYAALIETFTAALALRDVVLVGHSLGSAIALTVARRAIAPLRALVLLGVSARMPVGDTLLAGSLASLEEAADFMAENGFAQTAVEARDQVRRMMLATGATTTFGDFLACNRFDLRRGLAAIDIPSLVIAGEEDRLIPVLYSRTLADGLPSAHIVTLEQAGHYTMMERPEQVTELIAGFLESLDNRRMSYVSPIPDDAG
jgi:pimeloyl-ACP methyl ester carboxylesterase